MTDLGDPPAPGRPRISTVVLAAGRSSRMGRAHKLLEVVEGRPILAWSLDAPLEAALGPVVVVTGHRAEEVGALVPEGASHVHNPRWAEGMATSLRAGLDALPGPSDAVADAVAIALGDMPAVRASHFRAMAAAWSPGRVLVPTHDGHQGHPVLWPWSLVGEFARLTGDTGAKPLLARNAHLVDELPMEDPGVVLDVDDADDLLRIRDVLAGRTGGP